MGRLIATVSAPATLPLWSIGLPERERNTIMAEHTLFYYPYASFTNAQLPLLKVAALYFDKLVLLDPVGASWDTIGADHIARDAVRQLKDAGILEVVTPALVLAKYATQISDAVRQDMADPHFLSMCDAQSRASGKQRWTLSLAKVPQDLQADDTMRQLLGTFARDVAHKTAYAATDYIEHREALASLPGNDQPLPYDFIERAHEYSTYAEVGKSYDEYREGYDTDVEYRYADFPLALGEAIMMNHALFTGLLHAGATPITDDPFHDRALALKLQRAAQLPDIRAALADRTRTRELAHGKLAAATLTDTLLNLPILNPDLSLVDILEYRHKNDDALRAAREKLAWMARSIKEEAWSSEFVEELEHTTIPAIKVELDQARKARDAWFHTTRGRLALSAAGIGVGAAAVMLSVLTTPVTPIVLATAGLDLASAAAIPGLGWLLDWRDGKKTAQENGLRYLLQR